MKHSKKMKLANPKKANLQVSYWDLEIGKVLTLGKIQYKILAKDIDIVLMTLSGRNEGKVQTIPKDNLMRLLGSFDASVE